MKEQQEKYNLPKGWIWTTIIWTTIGDITILSSGQTKPKLSSRYCSTMNGMRRLTGLSNRD